MLYSLLVFPNSRLMNPLPEYGCFFLSAEVCLPDEVPVFFFYLRLDIGLFDPDFTLPKSVLSF